MKKISIVLTVLVIALMLLSACKPAAETAEQDGGEKTVTVWGFVWTADWLDTLIPGFEAANPGVKVVVERFEYDPYQEMVLTTLASGEGVPDVVTLDPMWAGDLIRVRPYCHSTMLQVN